ncbi:conserved Plasmodium protein, unknown function [Plasmodium gallinaceum]|uniref:HIT-type domain-containing protein n=1 Tax=Plasmodium gallinaceum TaxID=5849 RepID=A0A1J1GL89_PLAGA|nr:conserved Plasmodium protein, unknown function [Plasmodium gallinaceum]CRG93100.1 conserved Plasmodium protein, unknown function [Plasmodium gallinaceum]
MFNNNINHLCNKKKEIYQEFSKIHKTKYKINKNTHLGTSNTNINTILYTENEKSKEDVPIMTTKNNYINNNEYCNSGDIFFNTIYNNNEKDNINYIKYKNVYNSGIKYNHLHYNNLNFKKRKFNNCENLNNNLQKITINRNIKSKLNNNSLNINTKENEKIKNSDKNVYNYFQSDIIQNKNYSNNFINNNSNNFINNTSNNFINDNSNNFINNNSNHKNRSSIFMNTSTNINSLKKNKSLYNKNFICNNVNVNFKNNNDFYPINQGINKKLKLFNSIKSANCENNNNYSDKNIDINKNVNKCSNNVLYNNNNNNNNNTSMNIYNDNNKEKNNNKNNLEYTYYKYKNDMNNNIIEDYSQTDEEKNNVKEEEINNEEKEEKNELSKINITQNDKCEKYKKKINQKKYNILMESIEYFTNRKLREKEEQEEECNSDKSEINIEENLKKQNDNSCNVCKEKDYIYKCPYCEIRSCSLICSKNHKKIFNCKNKLKKNFKIKNVGKFNFNESVLYKDFLYLQNVVNIVEGNYKFIKVKENETTKIWLVFNKKLKSILKKREIILLKAPIYTKLHKENKTYIFKNVIYWMVKITFVNINIFITEDNVNENFSFLELINSICKKKETLETKLNIYLKNLYAIHISLFDNIRKEKKEEKKYYSINQTIYDALFGKSFYEYPHFIFEIFYNDNIPVINPLYDNVNKKNNINKNIIKDNNENENENINKNIDLCVDENINKNIIKDDNENENENENENINKNIDLCVNENINKNIDLCVNENVNKNIDLCVDENINKNIIKDDNENVNKNIDPSVNVNKLD